MGKYIGSPSYRRGSKEPSNIKVGIVNGVPSLQANWGGRIYGVPLSLSGSGNTKNAVDFSDVRISGTAIFDSGALVTRIKSDGLTISRGGTLLAEFAETTTVKDINLTGKIVITSSATRNVCVGVNNTDLGTDNVAIGVNAGAAFSSNTTDNVCIGSYAGEDLVGNSGTGGKSNVCIGTKAGRNITTGLNNICIGNEAGDDVTGGAANILIGNGAGEQVTTGTANTCLGWNAGNTIIPSTGGYGLNNVLLGYNVDVNSADSMCRLGIGSGISVNANYVFKVGFAGINTKSSSVELTLAGTDGSGFPTSEIGTNYFCISDADTGGSGSAGSGNQYIEMNVNGTIYKVLHDN